ncbi:MAG: L,D-transpeptidase [Deltaproteobacteria bacterium]|nr:L,D-transpeptidase [Deltaproteobacteria bacterium]
MNMERIAPPNVHKKMSPIRYFAIPFFALLLTVPALGEPANHLVSIYLKTPFSAADGYRRAQSRSRIHRSLATGRVRYADKEKVVTEHIQYENHERFVVFVVEDRLKKTYVTAGQLVKAGTAIGETSTKTDWQIFTRKLDLDESFASALQKESGASFVASKVDNAKAWTRERKHLFVPPLEKTLVIVHQEKRSFHLVKNGEIVEEVRVGFGQEPGKKVRQGDNKTPRGMYFTVQKYRGKFTQWNGEYYGGHWIKLNYPNHYDAQRGIAAGWLSKRQARHMSQKWRKRKLSWGGSTLGGGIGLHGWKGPRDSYDDWSDDDPWLTWGCVVFHNLDIKTLYDQIPKGAMVVLR